MQGIDKAIKILKEEYEKAQKLEFVNFRNHTYRRESNKDLLYIEN